MPEGPELHKNSLMVNDVCKGRIFSGKIVKSAVSTKNPDVEFPSCEYTIHAESRGKEMALILTSVDRECERKGAGQEIDRKPERLRILFRFGMSGKFTFGSIEDLHKHAHLNFYTKEKPLKVLSFVDVRRFVLCSSSNIDSSFYIDCIIYCIDYITDGILALIVCLIVFEFIA